MKEIESEFDAETGTALLVAMTVVIAVVKAVTRVKAEKKGNVTNVLNFLKVVVENKLIKDDAQEMSAHDAIHMQRLQTVYM